MAVEDPEKVLVIGGGGYLGKVMVSYLLEKGKQVSVFDLVKVDVPSPSGPGRFMSSIVGSITDTQQLSHAMEGIDTVYHVASLVDLSPRMSQRVRAINVVGAENVVKCCKIQKVKTLVYTSSNDIMLDGTHYHGDVEVDDKEYPKDNFHLCGYGVSKILAEKAIKKLCQDENPESGLAHCILRPVHIYGPHEILLKTAVNNVRVLSPLTWPMFNIPKHSMIHVKNVAHGHYLAAEELRKNGVKSKAHGQVYILSEGTAHNTLEYLNMLAKAKNLKLPLFRVPTWVMMMVAIISEWIWLLLGSLGFVYTPLLTRFVVVRLGTNFVVPHSKATRDFGYKPIVSFEEGYKETLQWFLSYDPSPSKKN